MGKMKHMTLSGGFWRSLQKEQVRVGQSLGRVDLRRVILRCPLCPSHLTPPPENDDSFKMTEISPVEVTTYEDFAFKAICRTHGEFSLNAETQRWERD